jgi:uncharacterized RDD family membrane protein YckC
MITVINLQPASFFRRLGALLYDSLLLVAWLMLSTFLYLLLTGKNVIPPENIFFQLYLIFFSFIFFYLFWAIKKQTVGMLTWNLKLHPLRGDKIYFWQYAVRFMTAILSSLFFGLGFFWMLVDKNKLTWHDKLSRTFIG